jgi:hypothetical protein
MNKSVSKQLPFKTNGKKSCLLSWKPEQSRMQQNSQKDRPHTTLDCLTVMGSQEVIQVAEHHRLEKATKDKATCNTIPAMKPASDVMNYS